MESEWPDFFPFNWWDDLCKRIVIVVFVRGCVVLVPVQFFSDKQETSEIITREIETEKIYVTLVTPDMSREEAAAHHNQWGTEKQLEMLDAIVKKHLDKGLYLDHSIIPQLKNKLVKVHWDEFKFKKK